MSILNLFRRKELLVTLHAKKVDNLSTQAFIKELAQSENIRVEDLAVIAAFFQEYLGFNILDEAKMTRRELETLLVGCIALHRRGLLVIERTNENYKVFSTAKMDKFIQELTKLQQGSKGG